MVKNPPAMQEPQKTQVQSLGQEDPLEEGIANHSIFLPGEIPWTEEPGRLQSIGLQSQTQLKLLSIHAIILLDEMVPTHYNFNFCVLTKVLFPFVTE